MAKQTKTKETVTTKAANVTKPKKRNVKKIILTIIAVVVVLFAIIFISANAATSAPAKVSNEFITYLEAGNADAAYSLFSAEAQANTEKDYFDALVEDTATELIGKPDMQSKSIYGETGQAATATVEYLIAGKSTTYKFTVNLVKEDGAWKIQQYDWEAN